MNRLILLLFVVASTTVLGQQSNNIITPTIVCNTDDANADVWTEYFSNNELTIEYKFVECDPEMGFNKEQVLLKMTNHTADELKLDWHLLLSYNQDCKTCDFPDEYTYHVFLKPNESKEGDCSIYSEAFEFKMFSRFLDNRAKQKDVLTSFTLSDFVITTYEQN